MTDSNYVLPEAFLRLPDSKWPKGEGTDCRPADGVSRVGQWSVEREIVGNMLPGQVRARSGLSVGSASASIPQTDDPMTPWSPRSSSRVFPRGKAELYLAEDHDGPITQRLGDWVVNPVSGSLTSPEVGLELVEASSIGKKPEHTLPTTPLAEHLEGVTDASWIVAQLASQLGYGDAPIPENPLIFVPFNGSPLPSVGIFNSLEIRPNSGIWEPWRYDNKSVSYNYRTSNGMYGLAITMRSDYSSGGRFFYSRPDFASDITGGTGRITVALTVPHLETVTLILGPAEVDGEYYSPPEVTIFNNSLSVVNRKGANPSTGTFVRNSDSRFPGRVEVQIERIWVENENFPQSSSWGTTRVRARSSGTSQWSNWVSNSYPSVPELDYLRIPAIPLMIGVQKNSGFISNFSVTPEPDPGTWVLPEKKLDIQPLGKSFIVPYLDGHTSPWDGIQEVCGALLAAAWLDWDGTLKVRNYQYLADIESRSNVKKTIDVDMRLEDISWVTNPDERADRLEVTYYPPDIEVTRGEDLNQVSPVVWQAEEAYEIRPGETIEIVAYTATPLNAPMTFRADVDRNQAFWMWSTWSPVWNPSGRPPGILSTWSAQPSRSGTGNPMGDRVLTVDSRPLSHSRLLIRIKNNTDQTLYTVDGAGNPHLIYRQREASFQENSAVIVKGVPREEDAVLPLQVDLTRIVQLKPFAEELTNHIWQRVSGVRWRAESVKIALDWDLDIGDLVRLQHAGTDLDIKALVTRVNLDGSAGEISQTVDLVILDSSWLEFDRAWPGLTWIDFDNTWANSTWEDFDNNPTHSPLT